MKPKTNKPKTMNKNTRKEINRDQCIPSAEEHDGRESSGLGIIYWLHKHTNQISSTTTLPTDVLESYSRELNRVFKGVTTLCEEIIYNLPDRYTKQVDTCCLNDSTSDIHSLVNQAYRALKFWEPRKR